MLIFWRPWLLQSRKLKCHNMLANHDQIMPSGWMKNSPLVTKSNVSIRIIKNYYAPWVRGLVVVVCGLFPPWSPISPPSLSARPSLHWSPITDFSQLTDHSDQFFLNRLIREISMHGRYVSPTKDIFLFLFYYCRIKENKLWYWNERVHVVGRPCSWYWYQHHNLDC